MSAVPSQSTSYERFGSQLFSQSFRKRFFSRGSAEEDRIVYIDNKHLPDEGITEAPIFPDNSVVSSKYTVLTFLPKNLFEQFRRIANFYFLCVALIQFLIDTPVTPLTSILPLIFVISVTAIKQGYEDWLRHRADNEVNMREVRIAKGGKLVTESRAMDIKVGDIVKVLINEEFPCDLILVSSEDPEGQCFVTTANLDGETNLKTLHCLNETRDYNTPEKLCELRGRITCKPPIADLYTFEGIMDLSNNPHSKPLGPDNLLLRGARLKNTEFVYGCAVYTGKDTKLTLNSRAKQAKFSRVERKMNTFLIVFLVVLLVESVVSTGLKYWHERKYDVPLYVPKKSRSNEVVTAIEHALAFMVLYNYIIPISLYVTVELQKFLGSLFFGWDDNMYDPSIDQPALANTSDLNEELGQVEYLFTDKTGTMTENTMEFKRCCIGSRQFEELDGNLCEKVGKDEDIQTGDSVQFTRDIDDFFKVLALCHTVRVDSHVSETTVNGVSSRHRASGVQKYEYQASSPDEKALVEACHRYGITYHGTKDDYMEVSFHNTMMRFKLLHILPFDPTRKRMSVIIQDEQGEIFLFCKGAEVAILDRVVEGAIETTQHLIDEYAKLGLRTLTISKRKLSQVEYENYSIQLNEAKISLQRREEMLSEVYNEIEHKLTLVGATAVEDKLQDNVPQTIEALRIAGIKVWVLTGDKEETAVNISHSAGHFNSDLIELHLTRVTSPEQCKEQLTHLLQQITLATPESEHSLVIDGLSLAHALRQHSDWLLKLCIQCVAVLCCRMSPIQKAEVVSMIKKSPKRPVTAAIGDGANDVSMIQEADVGFGIMGKEGRQAVRNSDYAFGKFRFLRRALLLHGHLYYIRIAVLVQYFFYKNVAWITGQLFYAIFNAWSEQSLYDPFFLVIYNLTSTSLPILLYGLFEQHKPKDVLLNQPELYRLISKNATLGWDEFLRWNLLGLWHCSVIFFGFYALQWQGIPLFKSGVGIGNYDFGSLVYYTCVTVVNLKLMLETYYWCLPTLLSYIVTFVGLVILAAIYTNIFWPNFVVTTNDMYETLSQLYSTPTTWFATFLFIVVTLLPDMILRVKRDMQWKQCYPKHSSGNRNDAANRQAQVGSTSVSRRPEEMDNTLNTPADFIELRHSALRGYTNPAMTLSSEDIPDIADNARRNSIKQSRVKAANVQADQLSHGESNLSSTQHFQTEIDASSLNRAMEKCSVLNENSSKNDSISGISQVLDSQAHLQDQAKNEATSEAPHQDLGRKGDQKESLKTGGGETEVNLNTKPADEISPRVSHPSLVSSVQTIETLSSGGNDSVLAAGPSKGTGNIHRSQESNEADVIVKVLTPSPSNTESAPHISTILTARNRISSFESTHF